MRNRVLRDQRIRDRAESKIERKFKCSDDNLADRLWLQGKPQSKAKNKKNKRSVRDITQNRCYKLDVVDVHYVLVNVYAA